MPAFEPEPLSKALRPLLLAAVMASLAACTPGAGLPPAPQVSRTESYRLGPGDRIRLITYGEEQLSNEFRISDSGNVALPLLGSVRASGRSTGEISQDIVELLKQQKLLRNPSVSVEVVAYRPVFVLGEVARPGEYPYQPGMTTLSAVAGAGGFTYRAVQDRAYVVRQQPNQAVEGILLPQEYMQPGDVIKVYERFF